MKPITTNVTKMRELLEDVTPEMHPGDYRDALVNMVYYALAEAERIGPLLNDNSTLIDMVREIESSHKLAWRDARRSRPQILGTSSFVGAPVRPQALSVEARATASCLA